MPDNPTETPRLNSLEQSAMSETARATIPLTQFIVKQGITATAASADHNPNMADQGWAATATHWRVTLARGRKRLTVPFSQGSAHTEPPTAVDVLDCLASDASSVDQARSFEEWCDNYGYSEDSRKAERLYDLCARSAKRLRQFLGAEAYETLLYSTERR